MATWKKIITSGSAAELSSLTLDTALPVAQGGIGATSLTDKAVLISQDSGTDAIGAVALTSNGQIIIGGSDGPAAAQIGGTTDEVEVTNGANSITIGLPNDVTIPASLTVTTDMSANHITASGNISASGNGSFTGTLRADGNVDFNGQLDVDGQTNLDDTDIEGTLVVDGTNISLDSTTTLNIDNSNTSNGIRIGTATSGVPITIGHGTSEVTIGDNLTVVGDLTVQGDTTTLSTTNTTVEDKFILLNSGSTSGDGGIIVSNGLPNSGSAFAYDDSENRWGFTGSLGATDSTITPDAYVSAVVTDDNEAVYRKNGNIRVDSGEIFIYVE